MTRVAAAALVLAAGSALGAAPPASIEGTATDVTSGDTIVVAPGNGSPVEVRLAEGNGSRRAPARRWRRSCKARPCASK